jgi:hypothetical protein
MPVTRFWGGRLQAGAPRQQWPRGIQLLHVPGRQVVAATSEEGRVVTNGMSQYSRAERNANSGMVVSINPEDYPGGAWLALPSSALESHAYVLGGSTYEAPAQLVGDFLAGRASTAVGSVEPSYQPGVHWTDLPPRCRILPLPPCAKPAGVRQENPRLRHARRRADRGGNPHQLATAHHPW